MAEGKGSSEASNSHQRVTEFGSFVGVRPSTVVDGCINIHGTLRVHDLHSACSCTTILSRKHMQHDNK